MVTEFCPKGPGQNVTLLGLENLSFPNFFFLLFFKGAGK
jgi:hypothetical protein